MFNLVLLNRELKLGIPFDQLPERVSLDQYEVLMWIQTTSSSTDGEAGSRSDDSLPDRLTAPPPEGRIRLQASPEQLAEVRRIYAASRRRARQEAGTQEGS